MSFKHKSTHHPTKSFIYPHKLDKPKRENIKFSMNTISILDDNNQLIDEIVPNAKILPPNLSNQQINERSLLEALDHVVKGYNLSIFLIGSSFSGKQQLFDGTKDQQSIIYYFVDQLISLLKKQFNNYELKLRMITIINQKVYDCLSDTKHSILRLKQDKWEGIQPTNAKISIITTIQDFKTQMQKAIKQKNKLILEFKDIYTSYFSLEIAHKYHQDQKITVINKINLFQMPAIQILGNSHNSIKIKQSSTSTQSLIGFTTILNDLVKYPDTIPHFECSSLTYLLKEILGGNSIIYSYFTINISEIQESLSTFKFVKLFDNLLQYPILNVSNSFGLIKKYRLHAWGNAAKRQTQNQNQKRQLEAEMLKVQTQEDYKRIMEKYLQLKVKLNEALKSKSQAQLQLIKCQEEKLEIGKVLVQVQIQNTKLIEKLQNKSYQNGKKLLSAQNQIYDKQLSYQQSKDKINQMNAALNQALQTKRDLQVQFIALKRNFLINQKDIKQLKQDNQALSLDLINISNQNQKLKKQILNFDPFNQHKNRLIQDIQNEKTAEFKRQKKNLEDNISYLKSELQRYKKQLIQIQMNSSKNNKYNQKGLENNYQRIQLENQKLDLLNKIKLYNRKIQELEDKNLFYQQQNSRLDEEQRSLNIKLHKQTQSYRKKLQQFVKNTNLQNIVKELKQNFSRKDTQNLDKINSLKKQISFQKTQVSKLKGYINQLKSLLDQWKPLGIQLPSIKKYENMDFSSEGTQKIIDELKIKNIKLQQQIRRIKQNASLGYKQSRVSQQIKFLRGSGADKQLQTLKNQKNILAQQNRRLTVLLKDGNKMDLNIIKKQNQQLRKEIESLKGKSSISPSTSDQKLIFYEKHLKILQKQRSQLLSRCVVAEEQLKNLLPLLGKSKQL